MPGGIRSGAGTAAECPKASAATRASATPPRGSLGLSLQRAYQQCKTRDPSSEPPGVARASAQQLLEHEVRTAQKPPGVTAMVCRRSPLLMFCILVGLVLLAGTCARHSLVDKGAHGNVPTAASATARAAMAMMQSKQRSVRAADVAAEFAIAGGLRPWDQACEMARQMEARLEPAERLSLIHGQGYLHVGKWVGYTSGVPRLGIPDLKLQDASSGFRPTGGLQEFGTVTQWPSLLSLASTWDEDLLRKVAAAIAREFRGKGANVLLGPGVNVHRTPYGGRNFEYLPGEAPYLGAHLVRAYVEGVQGEGVMAIMKHFAFNEQETNRNGGNSVVDEKVAWEVYYPPFEAAVEAGVGGAMCAYNLINGTWACHNDKTLRQDLKRKMGFEGFVMSDWQALHSSWALAGGSDMEMPGGDYFNWKSLEAVNNQYPKAMSEAVRRVLAAIYHLRLEERATCSGPCYGERATNQRTEAHLELAKQASADGVVLLKNDGVLPLRSVSKLAVIGQAADAVDTLNTWGAGSPYSGGGSGHVASTHVVTPLQGIGERAMIDNITVLLGVDTAAILGGDPSTVMEADVIIVVAGSTTTESVDRGTLLLDYNADALIEAVAKLKPTVVLMELPGAVVTPWRDRVAAIGCLFTGGETTGRAWASVLFGDVYPSGRLPITLPASEDGLIRPHAGTVVYENESASATEVAFPFGHGLSYTRFAFGKPRVYTENCDKAVCFNITITNVGLAPGRETVQVYIQWHSAFENPKLQLRTFKKTRELEPGRSVTLLIALSRRELSTYDTVAGDWRLEPRFSVHVGASSLDIRHTVPMDLLKQMGQERRSPAWRLRPSHLHIALVGIFCVWRSPP